MVLRYLGRMASCISSCTERKQVFKMLSTVGAISPYAPIVGFNYILFIIPREFVPIFIPPLSVIHSDTLISVLADEIKVHCCRDIYPTDSNASTMPSVLYSVHRVNDAAVSSLL